MAMRGRKHSKGSKEQVPKLPCETLEQIKEQNKILIERIEELTSQIDEQRKDITDLKVESWNNKISIEWLEKQMWSKIEAEKNEKIKEDSPKNSEEINEFKIIFDKLNSDIDRRMTYWMRWKELCPKVDVDFVWKIDQCTAKFEAPESSRTYSETFYSNNYKFSLRLSVDSEDNFGIFCHLMRGDYDRVVKWPMKHSVTIRLLNQITMIPHSTITYKYDSYADKPAFDRPKTFMDKYGIGEFYPFINFLCIRNKGSIVVNDSVIVTCVLNNP